MPVNIDLRLGDCLELMRDIPDGSIDLTVTSPPYDNLRDYGGQQVFTEAVWRGALEQLYRVTKDGGCVVWIVNDTVINYGKSLTSFKQALCAKDTGFLVHDVMIWDKRAGGNTPFKDRYFQAFEYMLIFSKGRPATYNLLHDRLNKTANKLTGASNRRRDGSNKREKPCKVKEHGRRYNIWYMPHIPISECTGHPAQYPVRLAQDHIVTWSNPGDTVLDPFSGSGTTGVACINTGRNFIGCEIDPGYYELAKKRLEAVQEPLCYV